MKVGEPQATFRQRIEVRRFQKGIAVTRKLAIPLIVGHDDNDIGFLGRLRCTNTQEEEELELAKNNAPHDGNQVSHALISPGHGSTSSSVLYRRLR